MEFRLIPAGTFVMGCKAEQARAPLHSVSISKPFYMGMTEVTRAQYRQVTDLSPSYHDGEESLPVEQVNYQDAVRFCQQLGKRDGMSYRLPSEAEWEYSARAGEEGFDRETILARSWNAENSGGTTHRVAAREPNAWGLYDMSGNVWEWVRDYIHVYETEGLAVDPVFLDWQGSDRDALGIVRGGAWDVGPDRCDPGVRVYIQQHSVWAPFIGFRVVRDVAPDGAE